MEWLFVVALVCVVLWLMSLQGRSNRLAARVVALEARMNVEPEDPEPFRAPWR